MTRSYSVNAKDVLEKRLKVKQKALKDLLKNHRFPEKPVTNPATLYVEKQARRRRSLGLGSSLAANFKQLYAGWHQEWKAMSAEEKAPFSDEALKSRERYYQDIDTWHEMYRDSKIVDQIDNLKNEVKDLKKAIKDLNKS